MEKNLQAAANSGTGSGGLGNVSGRRESLGEGQISDSQKQGLNTNPNNVAGDTLTVNNTRSLFEEGTGPP